IDSAPDGVGTVTGTACSQCSVELFFNPDDDGEGKYYHGRTTADVAGNWSMGIPYQNYPYLTATATEEFNNTSEFSAVYMMEIPVFEIAPSFSPDRTVAAPGEVLTYSLSLTNTGTIDAPAIFTNTIPISTTWIEVTSVTTGTLEFQSGI
nr:hypothetical protein [Gammaproteobacteria bacterium]